MTVADVSHPITVKIMAKRALGHKLIGEATIVVQQLQPGEYSEKPLHLAHGVAHFVLWFSILFLISLAKRIAAARGCYIHANENKCEVRLSSKVPCSSVSHQTGTF